MTKINYYKLLDLYKRFNDLCVDDTEFNHLTLEEQNDAFINFSTSYESCEMDSYMGLLISTMANCRSSWTHEDYENFTECLFYFNLRSKKSIEY